MKINLCSILCPFSFVILEKSWFDNADKHNSIEMVGIFIHSLHWEKLITHPNTLTFKYIKTTPQQAAFWISLISYCCKTYSCNTFACYKILYDQNYSNKALDFIDLKKSLTVILHVSTHLITIHHKKMYPGNPYCFISLSCQFFSLFYIWPLKDFMYKYCLNDVNSFQSINISSLPFSSNFIIKTIHIHTYISMTL